MHDPVSITACYAFLPFMEEELSKLRQELLSFGTSRGMKGLILLAPEGINATACGHASAIAQWKDKVREIDPNIVFKDSSADEPIFRKWSVKIKPEIVAIKKPDVKPEGMHRHLTPAQWQEMPDCGNLVLLDARDDLKVAVGKFRDAINPAIKNFHEFPSFAQHAPIPKDKKVLMYCTGGIRCEKALLAMEAEGYRDVYQLQGGILAYLEQFPDHDFEGECFVFDERVAVDQYLKPSHTFTLCGHCGDPVRAEACAACALRTAVAA